MEKSVYLCKIIGHIFYSYRAKDNLVYYVIGSNFNIDKEGTKVTSNIITLANFLQCVEHESFSLFNATLNCKMSWCLGIFNAVKTLKLYYQAKNGENM